MKNAFLFILFLTFINCQNTSNKRQESEKSINPYIGQWVSVAAENLGNGTFGHRYFDIKEDVWEIKFTLYLDSTLTIPVFEFRGTGPYDLQGKSEKVDGAENALFKFNEKYLTLLNDDETIINNFGFKACNLSKGVEQNITENGCSFFPSKNACAQEYDLLKLSKEGALYFGMRPADGNMCTEDKRPTELFYPLTKK